MMDEKEPVGLFHPSSLILSSQGGVILFSAVRRAPTRLRQMLHYPRQLRHENEQKSLDYLPLAR
jgi:hypothetical protein